MALTEFAKNKLQYALADVGAAEEVADAIDATTAESNNLALGASGTAGSLDIFPTTPLRGKLHVVAAANTGDTINTLTNAAQTTTATWTIPDTNGSAAFVMTLAAQVIAGVKTFSVAPVFTLGWTTTTTGPMTVGEGGNFVLGTGTGTQLGTATAQKLAFHGLTAVVQRANVAQSAVATTAATTTTAWGFGTQAQADSVIALLNELRAALVEKGLIKGSN